MAKQSDDDSCPSGTLQDTLRQTPPYANPSQTSEFAQKILSGSITAMDVLRSQSEAVFRSTAINPTSAVISGDVLPFDRQTPFRLSSAADLGAVTRQRRKALKLSQQQLADSAGVGRRFVSELENGKESLEFGKVLLLCRAVGVDLFAKVR